LRADNLDACLAACDQALRAQPGNADAHRLRGEVLLQRADYPGAVAAFGRALERGRPDPDLLRRRALACARAKDFRAALADATRALGLLSRAGGRDPETAAGLHALRGWAYLSLGAPGLAQEDFEQSLGHLGSADALIGRSVARSRRGQHAPAVADAQRALDLGPLTPELYFYAACAYARAARLQPSLTRRRRLGYQERAARLLRDARDLLPAQRRLAFERECSRNPDLDPLRHRPGNTRRGD
jgi:tetratricopeptide (TPR) repeat protein